MWYRKSIYCSHDTINKLELLKLPSQKCHTTDLYCRLVLYLIDLRAYPALGSKHKGTVLQEMSSALSKLANDPPGPSSDIISV